MRYVHLGGSGLVVSAVGLGSNNFGLRLDLAATRAVVDAALEVGVTLIDTADTYGGKGGSEEQLGEVLQGRRDEVVLATKFGMDMDGKLGDDHGARGSRWYVRRAVEASLRRLRTDHIDLYQMHAPDPSTPFEETYDALVDLVREGKVRYLGHSNFAGWQIAEAHYLSRLHGWPPFVSAQNHYSLLERDVEREVIPACVSYDVGVLPFFPLANGLLTGKVTRAGGVPEGTRLAAREGYVTDKKLDVVEALTAWGASIGRSLLEIAVAGLGAQPAVTSVIAGATKPEQVRANAAAGDWEPTADELAALDEIAHPRRPSR
ncbi:MAG TPA: aldo/keto reductase [Mycobacteriales bacterium]